MTFSGVGVSSMASGAGDPLDGTAAAARASNASSDRSHGCGWRASGATLVDAPLTLNTSATTCLQLLPTGQMHSPCSNRMTGWAENLRSRRVEIAATSAHGAHQRPRWWHSTTPARRHVAADDRRLAHACRGPLRRANPLRSMSMWTACRTRGWYARAASCAVGDIRVHRAPPLSPVLAAGGGPRLPPADWHSPASRPGGQPKQAAAVAYHWRLSRQPPPAPPRRTDRASGRVAFLSSWPLRP